MGISIGLVGLGQFGSAFAPLFKSHPLVDRVGLCDMEPDRIAAFADNPFFGEESGEQQSDDILAYGLRSPWTTVLDTRGRLFIGHGEEVYEGMIIGIHSRGNDLVVNAQREKKLTNIRAAGSDDAIQLVSVREMTLEFALEFIEDDELVEVTPKHIRLRKKYLTEHGRRQANKERLSA